MKRVLLIVLDILLIIVCLYFGILGLIFKDDYIKEENENNNQNNNQGEVEKEDPPVVTPPKEEPPIIVPSTPQIPVITEAKYDKKVSGADASLNYSNQNMDEMTLYEAFNLKGLNRELISFTAIKNLKDGEMAYTMINEVTILIWSDGYISNVTKERESKKLNSSSGNTISVGKINNHYIVTVNYNSKTKLIIYNYKFKKVLEKEVNSMTTPTLHNGYIFYGVDTCNKTRFDGSKGKVIMVYAFGTKSGQNIHQFNIDNNNGTC